MRQFLEDTHSALLLRLEEIEGDKQKQLQRRSKCEATIRNEENTNWRDCGKAKIKSGAIRKRKMKSCRRFANRIKHLDEQNSIIQNEKGCRL